MSKKKKEKTKLPKPIATAVWLVQNTTLTFDQIGEFCDMHPIEINSIGSKNNLTNVLPVSPIDRYLTKEEIEKCEKDPKRSLQKMESFWMEGLKEPKRKKYVSTLQKSNKLNAVLWLVSFRKEIPDTKIAKLVGSTKTTVEKIRNKTHRDIGSLTPKDPVIIGLCSKKDLENLLEEIEKKKNK